MISDNTLKLLSLIFTDTITKFDMYDKDIDIKNTPINNNSISLYDLVSFFNQAYLSFKKEYDDMKKINLGKSVYPLYYKDNELGLSITYPTIVDDDLVILRVIKNDDNTIKCIVFNTKTNGEFYRKEINLDESIMQKYLDLFKKYNYVLRLYNEILNGFAISDGTYSLLTIINKTNILENIEKIDFSIGIKNYMKFDISVLLGDTLQINEPNSKIIIDNSLVNVDSNYFIHILKNIYINKKYLRMIDTKEEEKTKHL